MAAVNDCFTIGSVVLCTTCFNQELKGEVLAFDHNTKMLILKCRTANKSAEKLNDVYVLNLSFCSNVQVIKEVNTAVGDPQKLNLEQLKIRLRNNVEQRQRWVKSINADAAPEGQELYRVIAKQFNGIQEVTWSGLNIQIFNEVKIIPPYRVEDVIGPHDSSLCKFIKKMVENFFKTQAGNNPSLSGTSSSSSSTSSSAPSTTVGTSSSNATSASPVPAN